MLGFDVSFQYVGTERLMHGLVVSEMKQLELCPSHTRAGMRRHGYRSSSLSKYRCWYMTGWTSYTQTTDDGDGSAMAKTLLRVRRRASHTITSKLEGYSSLKPDLNLDPDEYTIDNVRNTIGLQYQHAKGRKDGIFYIYRPDYSKSYNRVFHIVGMRWHLDWKVGG